jgi:hypothetical protein
MKVAAICVGSMNQALIREKRLNVTHELAFTRITTKDNDAFRA